MTRRSSLARRIPAGDFPRAVATIMFGTGAAQVITILSSPILTRLYAPADFGGFGVAASILAILIAVACLAYDYAIPLPADDVEAANVAMLCVVLAVGVGVAATVVLAIGGPALFDALGAGVLSPYVTLLGLATVVGGVGAAFVAWAIRTRSYREMAANRVFTSGLTAGSQITLGVAGAGTAGLLFGMVGSNLAGSLRLVAVAVRDHAASFRAVTRAGMRAAARRYRRFPVLSAPSNLLNTVTLQLPLLMIVAIFGAAVGGQFVLAQRVIALPASLVAQSVGQAFLAEAALVARTRPAELRPMFRRTTRVLAVTALPPVVLVAVAAPFVFPIAFGAAWSDAGLYTALLAPMYYLQFVTNPTAPILDVLERQDLFLVREVLRLGVLGAVFVIVSALGVPSLVAVGAVSAAGSLAYALNGLLAWRAIVVHGRSGPAGAGPGRAAGTGGAG